MQHMLRPMLVNISTGIKSKHVIKWTSVHETNFKCTTISVIVINFPAINWATMSRFK